MKHYKSKEKMFTVILMKFTLLNFLQEKYLYAFAVRRVQVNFQDFQSKSLRFTVSRGFS
jgi:hypothetical protein